MARNAQHPYCYPETTVYENLFGIRDGRRLEAAERLLSATRMRSLPERFPLTTAGYKGVHKHIFETIYAWAGEYRRVDTGRLEESGLNSPFCRSDYIDGWMEKRFAAIRASIKPGMAREDFVATAASHLNELNAIHPFLDGNGRTQRALLVAMGSVAAIGVDLASIRPDEWNHASLVGFHHSDHRPMMDVVERAMGPVALATPGVERGTGWVTLLVDEVELAELMALLTDRRTLDQGSAGPDTREPIISVLARDVTAIRLLRHRMQDGRPVPDGWVTGADALRTLQAGFGRGSHRSLSLFVGPGPKDPLLVSAIERSKARRDGMRKRRRDARPAGPDGPADVRNGPGTPRGR